MLYCGEVRERQTCFCHSVGDVMKKFEIEFVVDGDGVHMKDKVKE